MAAPILQNPRRNTLLSSDRLSYAQSMLPILRILPVGGVLLAMLLLILALNPPGASRSQGSPSMVTARGALLERSHHPEWRQLLILAATRRANELSRLRDLPDTPVRTAPDAPVATEMKTDVVSTEPKATSGNAVQDDRQNPAQGSSEDSPQGAAQDAPPAPPQESQQEPQQESQQDSPQVASTEPSQATPQEPPRDPSQDATKVTELPTDQASVAPDDATGSTANASTATLPLEIGEPSASELPVTKQDDHPPVITPARLKSRHHTRTRHVRVARRYYQPLPKPAPFPPFFPFSLFVPLNTDPVARAGTFTPD
jgi:hypothetical protein